MAEKDDLFIKVSNNFQEAKLGASQFENAMTKLAGTSNQVNIRLKGTNTTMKAFDNTLRSVGTDATRTTSAFNKMANSLNKIGLGANLFVFNQFGRVLANVMQSSLDTIETINLFSVSLGELAVQANETLTIMSATSGLDITTLQQAQGTYALLARSMGFTADSAGVLSENTSKLALDLSSLMNVPFKQAMEDLRSGLVGQTETVYKYGIDITEASLDQTAFALGIEKSSRAMTQGEKMLLRYLTMLRQTTLAQGDFARTIESPANQLRILGERLTTLSRTIGNVFMPTLQVVLPYLNGFVQALTELFSILGVIVGFVPEKVSNIATDTGEMSDNLGTSVDNTNKLAKAMKNLKAPFDELNVINEPEKSSGASTEGADMGLSEQMLELIRGYENGLDQIKLKSDGIRDSIMEWLGFTKEVNEETKEVTWTLDNTYTNLEKIRDILIVVASIFAGIKIGGLIATLIPLIGKVKKFVDTWKTMGWGLALAGVFPWLANLPKVIFDLGKKFGAPLTALLFMVERFYLLWQYSEKFQIGLERLKSIFEGVKNNVQTMLIDPIKEWFSNLGQGLIDALPAGLVDNVSSLFNGVREALNLLDIDLADFLITFGGIALLFTPFAPAGVIILGFEALSVAIRWIGTASEETFVKVRTAIFKFSADAINFIKAPFSKDFWVGLFDDVISWLDSFTGDFLTNTKNGFKEFWNKGVEPWFSFSEWWNLFKNALDALNDFIGDFVTDWDRKIGEWWTNSVVPWFTETEWLKVFGGILLAVPVFFVKLGSEWGKLMLGWWNDHVKKWFTKEQWDTVLKDAKTALTNFNLDFVKDWGTNISNWWTNDVVKWFKKDDWDKTMEGTSESAKDTSAQFTEEWKATITGWLDEYIANAFSYTKWMEILTPVTTAFRDTFKNAINASISMFNSFIKQVNQAMNISWNAIYVNGRQVVSAGSAQLVNIKDIPMLARGGMLEDGMAFIAGEMGKSEAIGSYQGKTTVMPLENTDFVDAIYDAVYLAVTNASENGGGQVIENALYLDGDVIYKNQQKVTANKGVNFGIANFAR